MVNNYLNIVHCWNAISGWHFVFVETWWKLFCG